MQRDDGSTRAKDKSFHPRTDVKMKTNLASLGTCRFQEAITKTKTWNQNDFKDDHEGEQGNGRMD